MKNRKKFWITFLFVCLCGLFVLLAGGVKWGTVGVWFLEWAYSFRSLAYRQL